MRQLAAARWLYGMVCLVALARKQRKKSCTIMIHFWTKLFHTRTFIAFTAMNNNVKRKDNKNIFVDAIR